jgi:hypothetical protein
MWRIDGPLDADALHAAIVDATARHPAMRTRFVQLPGEAPHQRFDAEVRVDVERVALEAWTSAPRSSTPPPGAPRGRSTSPPASWSAGRCSSWGRGGTRCCACGITS